MTCNTKAGDPEMVENRSIVERAAEATLAAYGAKQYPGEDPLVAFAFEIGQKFGYEQGLATFASYAIAFAKDLSTEYNEMNTRVFDRLMARGEKVLAEEFAASRIVAHCDNCGNEVEA